MPLATITPSLISDEIAGSSFIWCLRRATIGTPDETPIAYITAGDSSAFAWSLRRITCLTSSSKIELCIYADPTVSNPGVQQTGICNLRVGSSNMPSASVYRDPVVTNWGHLMSSLTVTGQMTNDVLMLVDQGNSLLITMTASAANIDFGLEFSWYEMSF